MKQIWKILFHKMKQKVGAWFSKVTSDELIDYSFSKSGAASILGSYSSGMSQKQIRARIEKRITDQKLNEEDTTMKKWLYLASAMINLIVAGVLLFNQSTQMSYVALAVLGFDVAFGIYAGATSRDGIKGLRWAAVLLELLALLAVSLPRLNLSGLVLAPQWLLPIVVGLLFFSGVLELISIRKEGGGNYRRVFRPVTSNNGTGSQYVTQTEFDRFKDAYKKDLDELQKSVVYLGEELARQRQKIGI